LKNNYTEVKVPASPPDTGPISLDQKTEPVKPVDINLSGNYKLAEPPIPRSGPQGLAAPAPEPKLVIPEKREEPKVAMVPPKEKPVEAPVIIRGEGLVQAISLDKDTYRQGEVAALTVTAVLPLDNARIDFLYRDYKVYPAAEKNIYKTVLAVPMETQPKSYFMTISYDEGSERKSLQLPFKVILGDFPHHDTAKMEIPILTEETLEMLYYEGGYFGHAYTVNPPDTFQLDRDFIWPCSGSIAGLYAVARRYNKGMDKWRHRGIDIGAVVGTPIVAPSDGVVALAKNLDVHGKSVVIAHGEKVHTVYLHLSRIAVQKGEWVKKGQVIGYVGRTGLATGPNLHWQVMVDGVPTDPRYWVKGGTELGRRDHVESDLAGSANP
jgi:hypothetical protein